MEPRFGADFSGVRVHTGGEAVQMNRELGAQAFTHGSDVYFGAGKSPGNNELTAHELTHVVQQMGAVQAKSISNQLQSKYDKEVLQPIGDEGYRIAVAPELEVESEHLEREADVVAEHVIKSSDQAPPATRIQNLSKSHRVSPAIQRMRVPLPRSIPLCGRNLTHIDIEAPRSRDLQPCLPPGVPVTRINIVGRQVSSATTGKGRQVFNLHVGYYKDPATGRFCGIVDDSQECIAPRCKSLGCFPTRQEVIDAIKDFLISVLQFLGSVLYVIIAIILGLLLRRPIPAPI
jgi:hypothetical protein